MFFQYKLRLPLPVIRSAHLTVAFFSALLAAAVVLSVTTAPTSASGSDPVPSESQDVIVTGGAPAVAGEILVGYRGAEQPETVEIPEETDPAEVAAKVDDAPSVSYAIPNYVATTSGWLPNDRGVMPGRPGNWGGWRHRQWNFLQCLSLCHESLPDRKVQSRGGMNVIRAWQHLNRVGRSGANGVKVAVIDTGIAYRDYGKRFKRSPGFGPRRFVRGYDFVSKDRLPLDLNGHGTHVASTIGEQTNDRTGLTGIAYHSKLMPVRVMDANGNGNTADIVAGMNWATRHGARVMAMSFNFTCGLKVPPLEQAIRRAWRKGVVMVGSSGNIGNEACPSLPATSPKVISVGGTTESGCVATYTFLTESIDLAAPGGGKDREGCPWTSRNRPIFQTGMVARVPDWFGIKPKWLGTSMAAAHVAGGAAAVIASGVLGKKTGPGRVAERLKDTARLPAYAKGETASGFGAGIVNLGRATNPKVKTFK